MLVRYIALPALAILIGATPIVAQSAAPVPLSGADSTRLMELGHTYMRWMLSGKTDSLVGAMTKEFLDGSGGAAGTAERISMLAEHGGKEVGTPIEKMTRRGGNPQFWHEATFELFADEPLVIRLVLEPNGKIAGVGMGPKSSAKWDQ